MAAQGNPKLYARQKAKHLTLILLLLFSTTCWGEWTKVAENESGDAYIDFERLKASGATVHYWKLSDHLKPNSGGYLSVINYEMGDCEMLRVKTLQSTSYRHSMGVGESLQIPESILFEDEWRYPHPGSVGEWALKAACGQ